jgi:predicted DNA-binding antitoxin AbrB/MazE fold protein
MRSVKAVYQNGTLKLTEPVNIQGSAEVVITFLDNEEKSELNPEEVAGKYHLNTVPVLSAKEEQSEEYYKKLRQHTRYKAHGSLILENQGVEKSYSLYDYSAGGLSFICERPFDVDEKITAKIKYTASDEVLELHFDILIKRVIIDGDDFRIGCQFTDQVDEELWHMVMS